MTGQEERDALFARLFGLTAIIQSGLLVRDTPLASSGSSAPAASDLNSCLDVVSQLVALGEKKAWLRESAWWTLKLAIEAIGSSDVSWKEDTLKSIFGTLFSDNKSWTPEKVALIPLMQTLYPRADWNKVLSPTFKQGELLHPTNYHTLARILKVRHLQYPSSFISVDICLGCGDRRRGCGYEGRYRYLESKSSFPLGPIP